MINNYIFLKISK